MLSKATAATALVLLVGVAAQPLLPPPPLPPNRPFTLLFGEPYRSTSTVNNPVYVTRQWPQSSAMEITYHGWAQVASATLIEQRPLFAVQAPWNSSALLPAVYVTVDGYLGMTMSTTAGLETFIGPNVTLDTWFSFGVMIQNGASRSATLWRYPSLTLNTFTPTGDMLLVDQSVVVAGVVSAATPTPVPVYLSTLRVMPFIWTSIEFHSLRSSSPDRFTYQNGSQVGAFAFLVGPYLTVSCADSSTVFTEVRNMLYGQPIGVPPNVAPSSTCDLGSAAVSITAHRCLGLPTCILPFSNVDFGFDPCKGVTKWIVATLICGTPIIISAPLAAASTTTPLSESSTPSFSESSAPSLSESSTPSLSQSSTYSITDLSSSAFSESSSSPLLTESSSSSTASPSTPPTPATSLSRTPPLSSSPLSLLALFSSKRLSPSASIAPTPLTNSSPLVWRDAIASPTPATSAKTNTIWAWLVSLTIADAALTNTNMTETLVDFIGDAATALNVSTSRFILPYLSLQSTTTMMPSLLSFVIIPDAATDPTGAALVAQFRRSMQISSGPLRTSALLSAVDQPSDVTVVNVQLVCCASGQYAFAAIAAPCASILEMNVENATSKIGAGVVVAIVLGVAITIVLAGYRSIWWCQRRREPGMRFTFLRNKDVPMDAVNVVMNANQADPTGVVSPVASRSKVMSFSGCDIRSKRLNRTRMERLEYGARDKFNQGAHTMNSESATLW